MTRSTVVLPFVRSPFNYDRDLASDESGLLCEDPSLTVQAFKEDCDINVILDRWTKTGELPDSSSTPKFGDFTSTASDYHASLNMVIAANEAFDALPAKVRARFGNDPTAMLDFLNDDVNRSEAIELGLVSAPIEDLSTGASGSAHTARTEATGGKSGRSGKTAVSPSNGDLGGSGDE